MKAQENFRPTEAAEYLRISKSQLWNLIREGEIKAIKLSPQVTIIRKKEIDEFLNRAAQGEDNESRQ